MVGSNAERLTKVSILYTQYSTAGTRYSRHAAGTGQSVRAGTLRAPGEWVQAQERQHGDAVEHRRHQVQQARCRHDRRTGQAGSVRQSSRQTGPQPARRTASGSTSVRTRSAIAGGHTARGRERTLTSHPGLIGDVTAVEQGIQCSNNGKRDQRYSIGGKYTECSTESTAAQQHAFHRK